MNNFSSLTVNDLSNINGGVNWTKVGKVALLTAGGIAFATSPVIGAAVYAGGASGLTGLAATLSAASGGASIINDIL